MWLTKINIPRKKPVLRIRYVYPDPVSWVLSIPDNGSKNKREGWKFVFLSYLFCSHKYHKMENYFIFELVKNIIWANLQKIIELFTQKIVIKLSKI
jgi:hypothetical protein